MINSAPLIGKDPEYTIVGSAPVNGKDPVLSAKF